MLALAPLNITAIAPFVALLALPHLPWDQQHCLCVPFFGFSLKSCDPGKGVKDLLQNQDVLQLWVVTGGSVYTKASKGCEGK